MKGNGTIVLTYKGIAKVGEWFLLHDLWWQSRQDAIAELHQRKLRADVRENFLYVRQIQQQDRFSWEILESPRLEGFRNNLTEIDVRKISANPSGRGKASHPGEPICYASQVAQSGWEGWEMLEVVFNCWFGIRQWLLWPAAVEGGLLRPAPPSACTCTSPGGIPLPHLSKREGHVVSLGRPQVVWRTPFGLQVCQDTRWSSCWTRGTGFLSRRPARRRSTSWCCSAGARRRAGGPPSRPSAGSWSATSRPTPLPTPTPRPWWNEPPAGGWRTDASEHGWSGEGGGGGLWNQPNLRRGGY